MSEASDQLRESIGAALLSVIEDVVRDEVRAAMRDVVPKSNRGTARDELLKVEQVADELQVKRTTVRTWIRVGNLRATLLGPAGKRREYRIRRSDLEDFLAGEAEDLAPRDIEAQAAAILSMNRARRS